MFRPTRHHAESAACVVGMKRAGKEHVQIAVATYLKRRRFPECESEVQKEKTVDVSTAIVRMAADAEASAANVCSFGGITLDPIAYEQQFQRLVTFIRDAAEPFRAELMHTLFPVFTSMYMDMLCCGLRTQAHKFHSRNQSVFVNLPNYKSTIEIINNALAKCDQDSKVSLQTELSKLRESRYNVTMSLGTLHYLQQFLKQSDNMLTLQVLNSCIAMEILPDGQASMTEGGTDVKPLAALCSRPAAGIKDEASVTLLKQHADRLRRLPPVVGNVCLYTFINAYQGLCSATISADSRMLCGGFEDSSIRLWSLTQESMLQARPTNVDVSSIHLAGDYVEDINENNVFIGKYDAKETITMRAHSGTVYATSFTNDSGYLLSASEDMTVRLWNMESFTNAAVYRGHTQAVWALALGSCGDYFATASRDRTARLWSLDRTFPLRTYAGHTQDVDCVRFHPNGNYLATGSLDHTVRLWNVQDGRLVRLMTSHKASVLALAFSPNGQLLASAGEDRRVKLWDLASGQLLKDMRGHSDCVYCLSFSPDGCMLASGGLDCTIKVWDVRYGVAGFATTSEVTSADANGIATSEVLASFSAKSNAVHFLRYGKQNVIEAAGATTW